MTAWAAGLSWPLTTIMGTVNLIWFLIPAAFQTVLAVILLNRRFYRVGMYPIFFLYTLYSIGVTFPRLTLAYRPALYPAFYWGSEVVYGLLSLWALNEVFRRIFFLDYQDYLWLRLTFPAVVFAIIAGLFIWWRFVYQLPTGGHLSALWSAFLAFNFGVHSVEGILMCLFLFMWWLLIPGWNRYDYGILLGFGISAAITMAARIERFYAGSSLQGWYKFAPGIGYVLATLIWLHAFWKAPDPQRLRSPQRFQEMLEHGGRNNAVIDLIHQWLRHRQ